MKVVLSVVCCCLLASSLSAADPLRLDPNRPYSAERRNPVTYDAELVVTVTAPYKTKLLKVWLPIPLSDHGQDVSASELTTFPESVRPTINAEPLYGNRFAYFEFPNPQGAQAIRHKLRVKVWELRWNLDPSRVQSIAQWPDSFDPYRRNESQAVVFDERFEKLMGEIVPQRRNPLLDLNAVMSFAERSFAYDHSQASLKDVA